MIAILMFLLIYAITNILVWEGYLSARYAAIGKFSFDGINT